MNNGRIRGPGLVLVDAGPLVAILSRRDASHAECVKTLRQLRLPLLTCLPVLTEADHLLLDVPGASDDLLAMLQRGELRLLSLGEAELLGGVRAYLRRYRSLALQLADACLAHLGDREGVDTLFTLDRRDFGAVVLLSGVPFQLLP